MGRLIKGFYSGTQEDFLCKFGKDKQLYRIENNGLYISQDGRVFVVTTREWVNFLVGKTDTPPISTDTNEIIETTEEEFLDILKGV